MKPLLSFYKVSALTCCLFFSQGLVAKPISQAHTSSQPQPAKQKNTIEFTLQGLEGKAKKNADLIVQAKINSVISNDSDAARRSLYNALATEVQNAIQPFGYFKAKVKTSLRREQGVWKILINVSPGPRLKFSTVTVKVTGPGSHTKRYTQYLDKLPIKSGDYFNSEKYEAIKERLQNIGNSLGFFSARITKSQLVINLKTYTSTALILYHTGPRYKFGDTSFSSSPIKNSLLRRYLLYAPGEYYWDGLLENTRTDLNNSPYFQQVIITPRVNKAVNLKVPIDVKLYPQDQVNYTFGAGYGTDTGLRGLVSMDLRYLNAAGHTMKILMRGSQLNSQFSANYNIPGPKPTRDLFSITGGLMHLDQLTGQGDSAQLGVSYQTQLWGWSIVPAITYLIEKYQLFNYPVSGITTSTDTGLLFPSISLKKIIAQPNIVNPSHGFSIAFTASGARENLGSRTNYTQYRLDTRLLFTIKPTHTRILTRASFGATDIATLEELPLSMQFFAGGAGSLRPYSFNSIGPGRYLAVGSFELQQRVFGDFYVAGFIDAGNVSNELFHQRLKVGAGPALVYLTPIGPIELSIGKKVGQTPASWSIQFNMGAPL